VKLLFVSKLDNLGRRAYTMNWRTGMKLLLVSKLDRFARAVSTITKYVQVGKALGHEVAVFGEQQAEMGPLPYTLGVKGFDYVIFVVYETKDFPDLPYLAQLLDGTPKGRRVVIDCGGRYNETIRVEHDFNHLEKLDSHQGWEWVEGFQAVSDKVLQPTLHPLRPDVRPFLFHAYDAASVARPYGSAREAARAWAGDGGARKPYGVAYVGHNWQRWSQIRRFLEAVEPLKGDLGPMCLAGWRWDERPDWAVELGIQGVDTDPALLGRLGVEAKYPIAFNEVIDFMGQARFCPIFHRPLFNQLGLVTTRTFETFCADTIPLLMLPGELVEEIYGPAGRPLAPGDDVAGRLRDMLRRPEVYWDAVLKVRAHLAQHHSYQQRFKELLAILES
jgi:hypothetical protein